MPFLLFLESKEKEIVLRAQGEEGEEVFLQTTPLAFTPWSILFRDFLHLLYWVPHSPNFVVKILEFFEKSFVIPDEAGIQTNFRIEQKDFGARVGVHLLVWQTPSISSTFSIQVESALLFLNILALGLLKRDEPNFLISAEDAEEEELFQYHGEIRSIEDDFRATGLSPFWITPEIQRYLAVGRAYDLGLPPPSGIPAPLLNHAEEKVFRVWSRSQFEEFFQLLSLLEEKWRQQCLLSGPESGEGVFALENWIFILNLLGFLDRFLAGVLPTRLSNPVVPVLSFLLERFFITQWESRLWPARRSALEETYRNIIAFVLED